jgi:hypothetical protein
VLLDRGILIPDADGKAQKRESLPCDKRQRCYVLSAAKLWSDES